MDISQYIIPMGGVNGGSEINYKNVFLFLTVVVAIILILIIAYVSMKKKDNRSSLTNLEEDMQQLLDPLTLSGWEVIVSDSCPYCTKQKEVLKNLFPTFNKFFTDRPANVVPTWVNKNTGQTIEGLQNADSILKLLKN